MFSISSPRLDCVRYRGKVKGKGGRTGHERLKILDCSMVVEEAYCEFSGDR